MIHVTLPWKPHAKQRPRFNRKTGTTYTSPATRDAEKNLREEFFARANTDPIKGPLRVTIMLRNDAVDVSIEPADEHTHKKLRGDIDNYAKTVLDALNMHAWDDDAQIVDLRVVKQ